MPYRASPGSSVPIPLFAPRSIVRGVGTIVGVDDRSSLADARIGYGVPGRCSASRCAPLEREAIYDQMARAALRLGRGTKSRLILRTQPDERWHVVACWPPEHAEECREEPMPAPDAVNTGPYAIAQGAGGCRIITVSLMVGTRITGALHLESEAAEAAMREYGQLLAIYARDATLTLDHVERQTRLEHLAVMGERGRIARIA